jgi:AAA domain
VVETKPLTVDLKSFAESKGFAADLLASYGVRANFDRVEIPYYDFMGRETERYQVKYDNGNAWAWNRSNGPILPYGLQRPIAWGEYVFVVEGASDCWALWSHRQPALGVPGATATNCLSADQFGDVPEVVVVREPDEAGSRFPVRVGRRLRETGFAGSVSVASFEPYKDPRAALIAQPASFDATVAQVLARRAPLPDLGEMVRPVMPAVLSMATLLRGVAPTEYLIDRLLPVGGSMLVGAQRKAGKTTLLHNLALAVARGARFLDRGTRPGRVLFISLDESRAMTHDRAERLGATADDHIDFICDRHALSDWPTWLRDLCTKRHYNVLLIDTLAKLLGIAEVNSYGEWNAKLLALHALADDLHLAWAGSHHLGKDMKRGMVDALVGSVAAPGGVDTILTIARRGYARAVATEQRDGYDLEPTVLEMDEDSYSLRLGDAPWRARQQELQQRILNVMSDGAARSTSEIFSLVRAQRGPVLHGVATLVADGLIDHLGRGRYALSENAHPIPTRCGYFIGTRGERCQRCGAAWDEHS